jgi:hypothetical protein
MISFEDKQKIKANVGKIVTIENQNNYHTQNGLTFNFGGTLECDGDDYYVRVGDHNVAGSMGIGFQEKQVEFVEKRVYGELKIVLR